MKILTIVGARPQFVKCAVVSRAIAATDIKEVLVHTGQHYDANMSEVFFEQLDIRPPDYNLGIAGGTHGDMTSRMLKSIENLILEVRPDWLLVYGDTNSTLAGALAAAKLHLPIAHVEAGLRSFNRRMPEEINRLLTDAVSELLFCPTTTAIENLAREGITKGVHNVGDVMYDVALHYRDRARETSKALEDLKLIAGKFVLATCHRAENTDDRGKLREILQGLDIISSTCPVVLPVHPRTRKLIADYGLSTSDKVMLVDPLPFLDMVALEQAAYAIVTDSGGVQKEAFFYRVPCITLREETEWVETVELGWNQLVGASAEKIGSAFASLKIPQSQTTAPYGTGASAQLIVDCLLNHKLARPTTS